MGARKDIFNYLQEVRELRDAAEPFIHSEIVTKTSGTEPLMARLDKAISAIDAAIKEINHVGNTRSRSKS